jgi:hypothetical protein
MQVREEDRFSKVLAVFHEYLLDLDHDIEGCSGPELDQIDQHRVAALELRRRLVVHVTEGADARGQTTPPELALFYIQDTRTYVGDAVLWWRPGGHGYTTKLGEAGLFTKEKAHTGRETDKAIPVEAARRAARIVVHGDDLRGSLAKEKEKG